MKNAAGHPVPPSAPTLTPLYTQTFSPYSPENCTHNKAIFAYKVGLGTINYLKTEHTSLCICHNSKQQLCQQSTTDR